MARQDILNEIEGTFGAVPGYLAELPDGMLESNWEGIKWFLNDSALSGREKALVAFGAASAIHCRY